MEENGFKTAHIDELAREDGWSPIRQSLGVRAFGINAWTAREADSEVIEKHDEAPSGHEELYIVTSGKATFTVQGERIDAVPGTLVFVPDPAAIRGAVAEEPGTTVLVIGARPGEAFRPRSWEASAQVIALLDRGENEEAKRVLTEALARGEYEDSAGLLYNLACAEALLGETDSALGHLRDALAERPAFATDARGDDDLAALRDDPRFAELTADG